MMGVNVVQLTSKSHHENILSSLHQLRSQGLLSDVTVQVDFQGSVQEFQAHQVVLAASSGYFRKIFLSEDAGQDQLLLSNMHADDFSKFLEFVYTGKVEVANDKITDVQSVAQLLDCKCLSELCGEAVNAGIAQTPKKTKSASNVNQSDLQSPRKRKRKKQNENLSTKQHQSPNVSKDKVIAKRCRTDTVEKNEEEGIEKLVKQKKCGNVVELQMKNEALNNEKQPTSEGTVMKDRTEGEAQPQSQEENSDENSAEMLDPHEEDWDYEESSPDVDPEAPSLPTDEEQTEEDGESKLNFTRTSKGKFQCNKCHRTFHYERSYLKHISTYHGVKADVVYRCLTCQQTFANRSNLKIHEKHVHSNERLFTCSSCSKTFKRKKDVVRHQRQVHERNNMRHVCPECGKALSSKTALLLHERTHTGAKPFHCPSCDAKFSQKAALKMHYRTHTGEKPFACDECDARFTQKHMLAYHKRSHTGEKPFMCEACGKNFASKEYLRHHSNIHTGFKPHKCEHCGRGFAQRNSLHQHLKTHTGERPYSCKDCDKTFTQINALQRHWRIHTGEKPYMCGLCNRTFTDMSTLRRHIMIHDCDAPWKTYLVVLEGNVEDKKSQTPTKGKTEKTGEGEKKSPTTNSAAAAAAEVTDEAGVDGQADAGGSADAADGKVTAVEDCSAAAESANKTSTDSMVVPAEPVSLPSDWPSHGTIALVSHTGLGGITVIHTEVPPGAQIQPIVATDSTGANIFSLDGSGIPFSIPVSMAHPVSLSTEASSNSHSVSVPVSDGTLASVSGIPIVSSSVLEAAVSQTILAPDSETRVASEMDLLGEGFKTVVDDEQERGEKTAAVQGDKEQRREDSVDQLKKTSDQESV